MPVYNKQLTKLNFNRNFRVGSSTWNSFESYTTNVPATRLWIRESGGVFRDFANYNSAQPIHTGATYLSTKGPNWRFPIQGLRPEYASATVPTRITLDDVRNFYPGYDQESTYETIISGWIKVDRYNAGGGSSGSSILEISTASTKATIAESNSYLSVFIDSSGDFTIRFGDGTDWVKVTAQNNKLPPTGQWFNFVVVVPDSTNSTGEGEISQADLASTKIYIDGRYTGTPTVAAKNSADLTVPSSGTYYAYIGYGMGEDNLSSMEGPVDFDGEIAEIAIHKHSGFGSYSDIDIRKIFYRGAIQGVNQLASGVTNINPYVRRAEDQNRDYNPTILSGMDSRRKGNTPSIFNDTQVPQVSGSTLSYPTRLFNSDPLLNTIYSGQFVNLDIEVPTTRSFNEVADFKIYEDYFDRDEQPVLDPFVESRIYSPGTGSKGDFFTTGSLNLAGAVSSSFSKPLTEKTAIVIDLASSATTEIGTGIARKENLTPDAAYNDGSTSLNPSSDEEISRPVHFMCYYNKDSKVWEKVGSGFNITAPASRSLDDRADDLLSGPAIGFSPSVSLTIDAHRDEEFIESVLKSTARPFSELGFPIAGTYEATGSNLFSMSDYIDRPFLVEKIVYKGNWTNQGPFLLNSDDTGIEQSTIGAPYNNSLTLRPIDGNYQSRSSDPEGYDPRWTVTGHATRINTFFILRQSPYPTPDVERDVRIKMVQKANNGSLNNVVNTTVTRIISGSSTFRELLTYGQVSIFGENWVETGAVTKTLDSTGEIETSSKYVGVDGESAVYGGSYLPATASVYLGRSPLVVPLGGTFFNNELFVLSKGFRDGGLGREQNIHVNYNDPNNILDYEDITYDVNIEMNPQTVPPLAGVGTLGFLSGDGNGALSNQKNCISIGIGLSNNGGRDQDNILDTRAFNQSVIGDKGLVSSQNRFSTMPLYNYDNTSNDSWIFAPYGREFTAPSKYVLFPEDKLVFGIQAPVAFSTQKTNNGVGGIELMKINSGPGSVTIYGSYLQNEKPKPNYLNQSPQFTQAVSRDYFEEIHDQFDIETIGSFFGNYVDDVMSGSVASAFTEDLFKTYTSLIDSKNIVGSDVSAAVYPGQTGDPLARSVGSRQTEGTVGDQGTLRRVVRHLFEGEYDEHSVPKRYSDLAFVSEGSITQQKVQQSSLAYTANLVGGHQAATDEEAESFNLPAGSYFGFQAWPFAFPFEKKFRRVQKSFSPIDRKSVNYVIYRPEFSKTTTVGTVTGRGWNDLVQISSIEYQRLQMSGSNFTDYRDLSGDGQYTSADISLGTTGVMPIYASITGSVPEKGYHSFILEGLSAGSYINDASSWGDITARSTIKILHGIGGANRGRHIAIKLFKSSTTGNDSTGDQDGGQTNIILDHPRGTKYGYSNLFPTPSTIVFRRDRFGQFRDMLEQSLNTHSVNVGFNVIRQQVVTARFCDLENPSQNIDPYLTHRGNKDIYSRTSYPFLDQEPVEDTDTFTGTPVSDTLLSPSENLNDYMVLNRKNNTTIISAAAQDFIDDGNSFLS